MRIAMPRRGGRSRSERRRRTSGGGATSARMPRDASARRTHRASRTNCKPRFLAIERVGGLESARPRAARCTTFLCAPSWRAGPCEHSANKHKKVACSNLFDNLSSLTHNSLESAARRVWLSLSLSLSAVCANHVSRTSAHSGPSPIGRSRARWAAATMSFGSACSFHAAGSGARR